MRVNFNDNLRFGRRICSCQKETWLSYADRLEQYFLSNNVQAQKKKRAILLSVCGALMYQLIFNSVSSQKLSEKNFDELVKLVQAHHKPLPPFNDSPFIPVTVRMENQPPTLLPTSENFLNIVNLVTHSTIC